MLDKLNILGAPFGRVVWLDTDVLVRRNVDELCGPRWDGVSFAAALNSGHESRTCHSALGGGECTGCQHHGVHADERGSYWVRRGLLEQRAGNRSSMPRCVYEFNSGEQRNVEPDRPTLWRALHTVTTVATVTSSWPTLWRALTRRPRIVYYVLCDARC